MSMLTRHLKLSRQLETRMKSQAIKYEDMHGSLHGVAHWTRSTTHAEFEFTKKYKRREVLILFFIQMK